jgi:hypothetical protein
MPISVRYLAEDEIEREAALLLAEYAETIGGPVKLPVPVAEITSYHLALRLDFADLHKELRHPDAPRAAGHPRRNLGRY